MFSASHLDPTSLRRRSEPSFTGLKKKHMKEDPDIPTCLKKNICFMDCMLRFTLLLVNQKFQSQTCAWAKQGFLSFANFAVFLFSSIMETNRCELQTSVCLSPKLSQNHFRLSGEIKDFPRNTAVCWALYLGMIFPEADFEVNLDLKKSARFKALIQLYLQTHHPERRKKWRIFLFEAQRLCVNILWIFFLKQSQLDAVERNKTLKCIGLCFFGNLLQFPTFFCVFGTKIKKTITLFCKLRKTHPKDLAHNILLTKIRSLVYFLGCFPTCKWDIFLYSTIKKAFWHCSIKLHACCFASMTHGSQSCRPIGRKTTLQLNSQQNANIFNVFGHVKKNRSRNGTISVIGKTTKRRSHWQKRNAWKLSIYSIFPEQFVNSRKMLHSPS